jgi:Zn-dependent protease
MELIILSVIVLVFSVVLHEVAHGVMAYNLGDNTAKYAGRLTLNPIAHIDLYGSIIIPFVLAITHSPIMLGWAKPVPYNPNNIKNPYGDSLVAAAGPAANLLLAVVFGMIIRMGFGAGDEAVMQLLLIIVYTNMTLCLFNLIPIPPLDGSKVFSAFVPRSLSWRYERYRQNLEQNPLFGLVAIVAFVTIFGNAFHTLVWGTVKVMIGA